MVHETSSNAAPAQLDSATFALDVHARAGMWSVGLCVLLYWAIFLWASGRGYGFSDEAFHLVMISDPFSYIGVSNFGHLWHPIYLSLNGDIQWFRITGAAILFACGALFGLSVARFVDERAGIVSARGVTVLALSVCVSWQYQSWSPTPDYNVLNLCAILLFFSGLLAASCAGFKGQSSILRDTIQPVSLCAAGLVLMALTKATTAVLVLLLGLVWVVVLRPRRPLACIVLTAALTLCLLTIAMIVIDGGIFPFVERKLRAFEYLRPAGGGDVHGIAASVLGPFSREWWKTGQALLFAALLFGLGLGWSYLLTSVRAGWGSRWGAHAIAVALGIVILWWRVQDLQVAQTFMGFRLWRVPLLLVLIAFAARILWLAWPRIDRAQMRILFAAAILAVAPAAYSFGTNSLVIWHAAGAAIFWAAAMVLLATLAPLPRRNHLPGAIGFLCGVTSIGLLLSVMMSPGRIGAPLWEQTATAFVGPQPSRLAVNPAAAVYIETFQRAARENGFDVGMPIIGLSEKGLGLAFALGGKPLAAPWFGDGALPPGPERRASVMQQVPRVSRQMAAVPATELRQAWVLTGEPEYLDIVKTVLTSQGLNFPERYRVVSRASRSDLGWTEVLWKPLD